MSRSRLESDSRAAPRVLQSKVNNQVMENNNRIFYVKIVLCSKVCWARDDIRCPVQEIGRFSCQRRDVDLFVHLDIKIDLLMPANPETWQLLLRPKMYICISLYFFRVSSLEDRNCHFLHAGLFWGRFSGQPWWQLICSTFSRAIVMCNLIEISFLGVKVRNECSQENYECYEFSFNGHGKLPKASVIFYNCVLEHIG